VIEVSGWYDAGEVGTLLETNRTVLDKGGARRPKTTPNGVTFNDPVYIEDDVTITNSTIGPNVSLGSGTTVDGSTLSDSVVGKRSKVANSKLIKSLIGDDVTIDGMNGELNVTDHSRIKGTL
jgi:glucose-1-phosphate thymidylyltransferase